MSSDTTKLSAAEMDDTRLAQVVITNTVEQVAHLIDAGFDARQVTSQGLSLLHLTVLALDHPEMVSLLLGHGVGIERRNKGGGTPLTTAIQSNHAASVRTLLVHGADPDAPGNSDRLPLHFALEHDSLAPVLRALLQAGASLERFKSVSGFPALHHCVERGNHAALMVLLEFGQDPRARNAKTGENALAYAERLHLQYKGPYSPGGHNPPCGSKGTRQIVTSLQAWMDCQAANDAIEEATAGQQNKASHAPRSVRP